MVEPAEVLPHVAAHQHARAGDREHLADLVVLALVLLAALQPGPAAAAAGDGDADLQQLAPVVPTAQLGADDRGGGRGVGDLQEVEEGVRGGLAVVVQEPQPLHGFAVRLVRLVVGVVVPGAGGRVPAAA